MDLCQAQPPITATAYMRGLISKEERGCWDLRNSNTIELVIDWDKNIAIQVEDSLSMSFA